MPIRLGLIGPDGHEIPLVQDAAAREAGAGIFELAAERHRLPECAEPAGALVAAPLFRARPCSTSTSSEA